MGGDRRKKTFGIADPAKEAFNFEDLEKALKSRDKFSVDNWIAAQTGGQVRNLNSSVYEEWCSLCQWWSFPDLQSRLLDL